jgi:predicted dehydrogenase
MASIDRRQFGKSAALAGIGAALSQSRVWGANERIRIGCIGIGNRGDQVLDGFLTHKDAEVVAVCDIYEPYRKFAAAKVKDQGGRQPKEYANYLELLESKEVDAVVIGTPDHWHALQTIHACELGKDVYVEKPLSLVVDEGRRMVAAARKHNRVVQVGLQRRSSPSVKEAVDIIRSGEIGHITAARAFHVQNEWPKGIGNPDNEDPPKDFDWEAWLGPAPKVPYNKNRGFYRFRWFYDYSGGQLTNFGVHYLDQIQWALGQDTPLAVTAMGGKFAVTDNREIPDTLEVLWTYPNKTLVSFTQINANGAAPNAKGGSIEFRGTKGTLFMTWNGYEVVPDVLKAVEFPPRSPVDRELEKGWAKGAKAEIAAKKGEGTDSTALHARNFLDCVRSREKPNADVEIGHRDTSAALIGNIALKTKSYLEWDGAKEQFTNRPEANKLLTYQYRAPYKLPT